MANHHPPPQLEEEEKEKTIPVFTVLKNTSILKNIFLLSSRDNSGDGSGGGGEEENLVVGRHPDCDITLSHPSVSRFHLRLVVNSSDCSLSVVDLASVHGTWVMGKKIEPNIRVELKEGDTMQIGGSSRVYKLHWVPLSRVYDIKNPFVSPSHVCEQAKDIDQEGILEDDDSLLYKVDRAQSLDDDNSESLDSPVSNEKSSTPKFPKEDEENKSISGKEIERGIISYSFSEELVTESGTETSSWSDDILSEIEVQEVLGGQKYSPKLVDAESEKDVDFLEISVPLYPNEYNENPASANFKMFTESKTETFSWFNGILSENEIQQFSDDQKFSPKLLDAESDKKVHSPESSAPLYPNEYNENPASANFTLFSESEFRKLNKESESQEENLATFLAKRSISKTEREERMGGNIFSEKLFAHPEISLYPDEILLKTEKQQSDEDKTCTKVLEHNLVEEEEEADLSESLVSLFSHQLREHSCSPNVELLQEAESQQVNKENGSLEDILSTPPLKVGKQFSSPNICSGRCTPSSVLTIQTVRNSGMSKRVEIVPDKDLSDPGDTGNCGETKSLLTALDALEDAFTPDKEKWSSNTPALSSSERNSSFWEDFKDMSKNLFTALSENSEQYTPDKENMTPNARTLRSMVRMSKMKDRDISDVYSPSSVQHILFPSSEENPASKSLQKRKLTRSSSTDQKVKKLKSGKKSPAERVPFQTLFEYSGNTSKTEASALSSTAKSCNAPKHAEAVEMKGDVREDRWKWCMVVDTKCLLDEESRKALQLLRGLKGTHMIIPGIVLKVLDSMNRQGVSFKAKAKANCALQWIKECMADTNWWIHVESSAEVSSHIELSSPVIPESTLKEVYHRFFGGAASSVFTAWGSSCEVASSTAGDQALEYALQFRGKRIDEKFVLLSDDVTLKIKAMAEGLICETAQEFRRSLVNPFSERFMWSDSSPRGLTWSYKDDIVLKETFYGQFIKLRGDCTKGLKLILPRNTPYVKTSALG